MPRGHIGLRRHWVGHPIWRTQSLYRDQRLTFVKLTVLESESRVSIMANHYTIQYYTTLHYTIQYYTIQYYTTPYIDTVQQTSIKSWVTKLLALFFLLVCILWTSSTRLIISSCSVKGRSIQRYSREIFFLRTCWFVIFCYSTVAFKSPVVSLVWLRPAVFIDSRMLDV